MGGKEEFITVSVLQGNDLLIAAENRANESSQVSISFQFSFILQISKIRVGAQYLAFVEAAHGLPMPVEG